uniref:Transposase n=1 Tax=Panagrellus redivivus TaxID=6233 RepID=A0A7E4W6M2_PANRE
MGHNVSHHHNRAFDEDAPRDSEASEGTRPSSSGAIEAMHDRVKAVCAEPLRPNSYSVRQGVISEILVCRL